MIVFPPSYKEYGTTYRWGYKSFSPFPLTFITKFNNMNEFQDMIHNADAMEMIYWALALVSSVVFAIQAIILFMGFDTDADFSGGDVDFDADGLNLVSVKTVVCFLLGFGWTGALFYPAIDNKAILAVIAIAVGVIFMFLIAFLLRQVLKLGKDNTFRTSAVIGSVAEVYLRIPGGQEMGKVQVSWQGSLHELLASSATEIPTGAKVKIINAIDESTVEVEEILN